MLILTTPMVQEQKKEGKKEKEKRKKSGISDFLSLSFFHPSTFLFILRVIKLIHNRCFTLCNHTAPIIFVSSYPFFFG